MSLMRIGGNYQANMLFFSFNILASSQHNVLSPQTQLRPKSRATHRSKQATMHSIHSSFQHLITLACQARIAYNASLHNVMSYGGRLFDFTKYM